MKSRLSIAVALLGILLALSVHAQGITQRVLIPFGSSESSNDSAYIEFSNEVISQGTLRPILISLLPITLSSNPDQISPTERVILMEKSEIQRTKLETACNKTAASNCNVSIIPIFVREDALDERFQEYFTQDMDAIFIPEGDCLVASQIIQNTPLETKLRDSYQSGIIIGGRGAGALLFSPVIIEPQLDFTVQDSLVFGSVDIREGLAFLTNAVVDQNSMSEGNLGRLLNTISLPGIPQIGIGIEPDAGIKLIDNHRIENVLGNGQIIILDAFTYHAADAVEYLHPRFFLSLHNVLMHLLSAGDVGYDMQTRQHEFGAPPAYISRQFNNLTVPPGAGTLIVGGDLGDSLKDNPILTRFLNLSGGEKANILVIADGYSSQATAQDAIEKYQANLRIPTQSLIIEGDNPNSIDLLVDVSGIILLIGDQEQLDLEGLQFIKQAWLSGTPLLTDGKASEVIGAYYSPPVKSVEQIAATPTTQGLGMLDLTIVPGLLANNRWRELIELGYRNPELLAIGLNKNTALEITENDVVVLGQNVIFLLDLRNAILGYGPIDEIGFANGLLDVYVPGERIHSEIADINLAPLRAATPNLKISTITSTSTSTPLPPTEPAQTPLPTATRGRAPTKTPRPTITPPVIPPPGNPEQANLMILLAIFSVLVVLLGVWLNRRHFN